MTLAGKPGAKAGELLKSVPGVERAVSLTVGKVVNILNDIAHWSVNPERVYSAYREQGLPVYSLHDIFELDLCDVDRMVHGLSRKYSSLAGIEGAAAGVAGLPGIPADIVALVSLNQRAAAEYAVFCGVDISLESERLFAVAIMSVAADAGMEHVDISAEELLKTGRYGIEQKVLDDIQGNVVGGIIQKTASMIARKLTRMKAAQVVPVIGLTVGAGLNAAYTARVCDASYNLYRERFLIKKYGRDLIELL